MFIVVGIAAVSSNLIINGSTQLASNPDDFNVYFSDVLVNGTQDLSLVTSEISLVFTGEFSAVGDKKEITYDVTNASKNDDAGDWTCDGSSYKSWLYNGQNWWTKSAVSDGAGEVWYLINGEMSNCFYLNDNGGVRPVITISKEYLE